MDSNGHVAIVSTGQTTVRRHRGAGMWIGCAVVAVLLIHAIGGLKALTADPAWSPDYLAAMEYVAARHTPGEPVLAALPPPAYVALDGKEDVVFVSSPLDRVRAQQYTRQLSDGRYVDFWLGVRSIVSVEGLCAAFAEDPDLWLVVDDLRLAGNWALGGPMAEVMLSMTTETYRAPGGVSVRRLAPPDAMISERAANCATTSLQTKAGARDHGVD